jgi:hypothetical protein
MKKIYTFNDLGREYGKDATYVARMVKRFKLISTPAMQDNHICQALTLAEKLKLEKKNPNLLAPPLAKGEIDLISLAAERNQDVSGLLKTLKANEYTVVKRLKDNRAVNSLTAKDYTKFSKEHPVRVIIK